MLINILEFLEIDNMEDIEWFDKGSLNIQTLKSLEINVKSILYLAIDSSARLEYVMDFDAKEDETKSYVVCLIVGFNNISFRIRFVDDTRENLLAKARSKMAYLKEKINKIMEE